MSRGLYGRSLGATKSPDRLRRERKRRQLQDQRWASRSGPVSVRPASIDGDWFAAFLACPSCSSTREPIDTAEIFELVGDEVAQYVIEIRDSEDCLVLGCRSCGTVGVIGGPGPAGLLG